MSATAASRDAPATPSRPRGIVPAARWLRSYEPGWFRADLAAGVTLASSRTHILDPLQHYSEIVIGLVLVLVALTIAAAAKSFP